MAVFAAEAPDDLGQDAVEGGRHEAERELALDLADAARHGLHVLGARQHVACVAVEEAAGFGELERACAALEQRGAQLLFQLLDLPAQRGLGDEQALGRAGEIALFGNGDEVAQMAEFHGLTPPEKHALEGTRKRFGELYQ